MDDIQKKSDSELTTHINEKRSELRSLRFDASGSGLRNSKSIRNTRKELARALTDLNRRVRDTLSNTKDNT